MFYSDDPGADFDRHDAECYAQESKLPKCSCCGEPIHTDECYEFNDELICPDCLNEHHKRSTEDYIE